MPLVVSKQLMDKKIDGAAALGAVIKGETAHDEVIATDAARRLGDLSLGFRKPVTLGIIGFDASYDTALARAEPYAEHAVMSAVYLAKLLREGVEGPLDIQERHKSRK
jgi:6,7-dimethyl-8-ribityllumazine synthase